MKKKKAIPNNIEEVVQAIDFCRATLGSGGNTSSKVTKLLHEKAHNWMEQLYHLSGGKYAKLDDQDQK